MPRAAHGKVLPLGYGNFSNLCPVIHMADQFRKNCNAHPRLSCLVPLCLTLSDLALTLWPIFTATAAPVGYCRPCGLLPPLWAATAAPVSRASRAGLPLCGSAGQTTSGKSDHHLAYKFLLAFQFIIQVPSLALLAARDRSL